MGVLDPSDKILSTATARNKKVAEQEASRLALEKLDKSTSKTPSSISLSFSTDSDSSPSTSPSSSSPSSPSSPSSSFI
jgi:hypothetical protein